MGRRILTNQRQRDKRAEGKAHRSGKSFALADHAGLLLTIGAPLFVTLQIAGRVNYERSTLFAVLATANTFGLLSRTVLSSLPVLFFILATIRILVLLWSWLPSASPEVERFNRRLTFKTPLATVTYGLGLAAIVALVPWYYFAIFFPMAFFGFLGGAALSEVIGRARLWMLRRKLKKMNPVEKVAELRRLKQQSLAPGSFWDTPSLRLVLPIWLAITFIFISMPTSFWMPFEEIRTAGKAPFAAFVITRDGDDLVMLTPIKAEVIRLPAKDIQRRLCNPSKQATDLSRIFDTPANELSWTTRADFQPSVLQILLRAPRPSLPDCPARFEP